MKAHKACRWRLAPVLTCCLLLACGGSPGRPSFILISLDATRADHLGAYGYERDTTPFLDELARRGLIFEQAVAPSLNTLISHASLLTGLSAWAHGATYENGGVALHPAFTTVAEDLAAHGYQTAAFLAHGDWLVPRFGLDQGFESFSSDYRPAESVLAEARAWLSERASRSPYFLFLHLYDVHSDYGARPYDAPEPFRGRFAARDWGTEGMGGSEYLEAVNDGEIPITPEEVELIRDQYDEGLAYVDHQLRLFVESLAARDLERTWIVVVADHGEAFFEHGKLLHATLHDEVFRVPFLLVPPAGTELARDAPVRIPQQVRLVEVRPTLLSLAGLPRPEHCQGVDLVPCLESSGRRAACRSLPATLYRAAVRHQGFKLIRRREGPLVYDLHEDPGERTNLAGRPEVADRERALQRLLTRLISEQKQLRQQILQDAELERVGSDPEAEERLRALGYVD